MKIIYNKKEFIEELRNFEKKIKNGEKTYYNDRYSIKFKGSIYSIREFKEIVEEMLSFQLGKDNLYQIVKSLKYTEVHLVNKEEFTQKIINILKKLEQKDNIIFNDIIENIPVFLINQEFINWYFNYYNEIPEQFKFNWSSLFKKEDIIYEINIGNLNLSNEQMKFLIRNDSFGIVLEKYYLNNNIFNWIIKEIKNLIKDKNENIIDISLKQFRFILNNKMLTSKQLGKLIKLLPYKVVYIMYNHPNHSQLSFKLLFNKLKNSVYDEELLKSNYINRKQILKLINNNNELIKKIKDGWFIPSNKVISILRDKGLL